MARIRTVKPEFWTDERLTECSLSARLFFIGMLNFADDNGNQAYSAKRLKMQIFPADAIDTQPLIDQLLTHGVLIEYSVNDKKFIHIKGFRKHQLINRPSSTTIPQPSFIIDSVKTHGVLTDGEERSGKESIKKHTSPDKLPTCPTQTIVDLYHEALPELPAVKLMSDKRKKAISAFWKFTLTAKRSDGTPRATNSTEAIDWAKQFFERARDNDFLMGRRKRSDDHATWQCDLDFLMTEKGRIFVIEKTKEIA